MNPFSRSFYCSSQPLHSVMPITQGAGAIMGSAIYNEKLRRDGHCHSAVATSGKHGGNLICADGVQGVFTKYNPLGSPNNPSTTWDKTVARSYD